MVALASPSNRWQGPLAMGLSSGQRLKRAADYRSVFAKGRRASDALMTVTAARSQGPGARFGLSVSKKVGGAVQRNRVKRRLREILRTLELVGDWDVVITARPAAADAAFGSMRNSVISLSARLGMTDGPARRRRSTGR